MNKNMSMPIDHTKNGECSGCGQCCSALLCVSDVEINNIKKYLKEHPEVILTNRTNPLVKDFTDVCPFLSNENHCQIYSVRPEICSRFICSKFKTPEYKPLNHSGKKVVNMIQTFMPDSTCYHAPNLAELNKLYKEKKRMAGIED